VAPSPTPSQSSEKQTRREAFRGGRGIRLRKDARRDFRLAGRVKRRGLSR